MRSRYTANQCPNTSAGGRVGDSRRPEWFSLAWACALFDNVCSLFVQAVGILALIGCLFVISTASHACARRAADLRVLVDRVERTV